MAATLRHCGFTNKYLLFAANRTSIGLKQIPRKCFHTKNISSCGINLNGFSQHKFSNHHLVKMIGVRYASSDTVSTTPVPEGYILDTPPVPMGEGGANITAGEAFSLPDLTSLGEPTLQSLGLAQGGWLNLVTHYETFLQFVHVGLDVPWWVAVVLVSLTFRTMLIPVFVWQRKALINHTNIFPESMKLKTLMEDAKARGNAYETEIYRADYEKYMQENKYSKMGMFSGPLMQAPIFMTVYWSIGAMVDLPVEGLKTGGYGWFTDLTVSDPYYALPFLTSATLSLMMELGADSQKVSEKPFWMMCFMRTVPFIVFYAMSKFSAAMAVHWLTNNLFSLVQSQVLKRKKVQKLLNMPEMKPQDQKNKEKFVSSAREKLASYRAQRRLEDRKAVANMDFKSAGEGPVPKTYSYNPTKKKLTAS